MNLIPVSPSTIGQATVQTVNARDLHAFLESKKDFSNWMKARIRQYGFIETVDYLLHQMGEQLPSGTKYKTEYFCTLNMAKELAMVERNSKGREARLYFIECEQRYLEGVAKPQYQAEAYWFSKRPHWRPIRELALQGKSNRQIADVVQRSPSSVGNCVRRMVEVGLINPTALYRVRYRPHRADRLCQQQLCLLWGVAA